ncbi:MAG: pentapeptide repeat-containing protein [Alphaproteobacteria bacterium]|nr:pentapeptide repeat-containing protein [Alphaproteobacteria bacterium]
MAEESREEREERWWRDWFDADYSWDGLAGKEILGGGQFGEVTLQDYWRRDPTTGKPRTDMALKSAGELIEFDGRWWHLAHLPPQEPSWKADLKAQEWRDLDALLAERVAVATETQRALGFYGGALVWNPEGSDGRARLDGSVLGPCLIRAHDGAGQVSLSCHRTAFLVDGDFEGVKFGPGADFSNATFSGEASFYRATFSGDARFYSAAFLREASFYSTAFSAIAGFDSATFLGEAGFEGAAFSGEASFDSATFSDEARFDGAIFSGSAGFGCTTFSGEASFNDVMFSSFASFNGASFSGCASFDSATFSGYARFNSATFSGDARFNSAIFKAPVHFSGVFREVARFHNAVLQGPVTFSAAIAAPEQDFARAFYGARFSGIADFSGAVREGQGGRMAAAFAEAQFEKALILTDGLDGVGSAVFHKALLKNTTYGAEGKLRNERLATLESGCRVVKIAMGKARDEVREQAYYRLQLRARQQRSDIDGWEKAVGWLYGVSSDFGSSLWRPVLGLGLLVLVFAVVIYWPWMAWLNIKDVRGPGGVFVALNQSLRTLSPFNLLTSPGLVASTGAPASLFEVNPAVTFGVRIISGLQSILSTLLIFLFGLAVKRRFQIS